MTEANRPFELDSYIKKVVAFTEQQLDKFLPSEETAPAILHRSMRYSMFAGGKRIRPALCLAAAEACGGEWEAAERMAAAVEMIHTYSLIHDDLPAMDNDDFRRGKPTNHKVFGEGMAVLAGDALLTIAFETLSNWKGVAGYNAADAVRELAVTSGSLQLIAGQAADLEAEGSKKVTIEDLEFIHLRKTSALLTCSVRLGGMSVNANEEQMRALSQFGRSVGLAFQIVDDLLDITQTTEKLGKTAGKDQAASKATYPSLLGIDKSKELAAELTQEAYLALKVFGNQSHALEGLARYLLDRDY